VRVPRRVGDRQQQQVLLLTRAWAHAHMHASTHSARFETNSRGQHHHCVPAVLQQEALELDVGRQLAGAQVQAQPVEQVCRRAGGKQISITEPGRQSGRQATAH
jgi:hypothetical protein